MHHTKVKETLSIYKAALKSDDMENDNMNWQPEYEHHCASCGIDMNDGVDVIDTETMTAHVVCSDACIDEHLLRRTFYF